MLLYEQDTETGDITFAFPAGDISEKGAYELAAALTVQLPGWTPRDEAPPGAWHPVVVRVLRVSDMPHGVRVWVDDAPGLVIYYIDESSISVAGARSFERRLRENALSWAQVGSADYPPLAAIAG